MALYGAVEDGRKFRAPQLPGRLALDTINVTFTGTGSKQFTAFDSLVAVILDQVIGVSPGVGPSTFTYTINGNTVSLFSWQPTSNANPTLVAGTSPATISVTVIGVRRQGQSV